MTEFDHTMSSSTGHTCINQPAHVITMQFDMTTEDGRLGCEYALRGSALWCVLADLDHEMRFCVKHEAAPFNSDDGEIDDGMCYRETFNNGIVHATSYWRDRVRELREDYSVPLEV